MPSVEVRETLKVPISKAWKLISDVEAYPALMECVNNVVLISEKGNTKNTLWEINLKGSILKWSQTEFQDESTYRIEYEQIEGDLEKFKGYWSLKSLDREVTEAILFVDFEIGIPMLRDMLNPVAIRALKENSAIMLLSLGPRV